MLFFTRAFLCIGLIVALAEGVNVAGLFEGAGSQARGIVDQGSAQARRICDADPSRCLAVAAAALAAAQRAGDVLKDSDRPTVPSEAKRRSGRFTGAGRAN